MVVQRCSKGERIMASLSEWTSLAGRNNSAIPTLSFALTSKAFSTNA